MKIMVVCAHPDDEVLGCGATIAKYTQMKHQVQVVILGEGVASRGLSADEEKKELRALRLNAAQASKTIGALPPILFNLPDNKFDSVPLLDIIKHLEGVVHSFKPDMVFTQHGGDLNIDHSMAFRAVMAATRPMPGTTVRSVLAFEVNSSTEWAFQRFSPVFRANRFVDVSNSFDKKLKALKCYSNEMRPFPHPRSVEAVKAQALKWGSVAGLKSAEAFEVIWEIA